MLAQLGGCIYACMNIILFVAHVDTYVSSAG